MCGNKNAHFALHFENAWQCASHLLPLFRICIFPNARQHTRKCTLRKSISNMRGYVWLTFITISLYLRVSECMVTCNKNTPPLAMCFKNVQQCVSRQCYHLHVSKCTATSKENVLCHVFRKQTAMHIAFALPFVHICTFPNACQSTRKHTALGCACDLITHPLL